MDVKYLEMFKSLESALDAQMNRVRAKSRAPKKKQCKYIDLIRFVKDRDCFRTWDSRKRAYQKCRLKKLEAELTQTYNALGTKPATFLDYVYSQIDLNAFSDEDIDLWCSMYIVATTNYGYAFTAYAPNNHRKPLVHGCQTYCDFATWIRNYAGKVQSNDRFFWWYFEKILSSSQCQCIIISTHARARGRYLLRYFADEECFSMKDLSDITARLDITKDKFFAVLNTIIDASKKK